MYASVFFLGLGFAGFLSGIWAMRTGLEHMTVDRLPQILKVFVKTPSRGLLFGTVISALMHSSAAVTIIVIGLVSAGTMTFADSLGVILGSNIGTTITTQIIAFNPSNIVGPGVIIGSLMWFFLKGKIRYLGVAIFGFSLTLFALNLMMTALEPLGQTAWFRSILTQSSRDPLLGVLAGALLTALVQSSTATTALTIALASEGLVGLTGATAIVFGNNVGTSVTAIFAAIGAPTAAKRVAASHVLLNLLGVAVFLPILPLFISWVQWFGGDLPIQVATSHTLFNILSSLAIWPFVRYFARLVEWVIPEKKA